MSAPLALAAELGWGKEWPALTQLSQGWAGGDGVESGGRVEGGVLEVRRGSRFRTLESGLCSQSQRKGLSGVCQNQVRGTVEATILCSYCGPAQSPGSFSWGD